MSQVQLSDTLREWRDSAKYWETHARTIQKMFAPVTSALIEEAGIIEGDAVSLLALVAPVRVILANIISSVLIPALPAMRAALASEGVAIFSGILVDEREAFVSALERGGWLLEREDVEDVWWTAVARPT